MPVQFCRSVVVDEFLFFLSWMCFARMRVREIGLGDFVCIMWQLHSK
jgi:hypothetical protein